MGIISLINAQRANIKNYDACRSLRVTSEGKFINFDLLMGGRENAGLVFLLFNPAFLLIVPSLFSSPI